MYNSIMLNMRTVVTIAVMALPLAVYAAVANVPYCNISSSTTIVNPGTKVRLVWYTANATYAAIAGIGQVAVGQGYYDVYPQQNSTYTMTVANASGSRTCAALITMARPQQPVTFYAPTATPTYTPITFVNTALPVTRNYTETTYYYDGPYTYSYYDAPTSSYYETNTSSYYYPPDNIAENYYLGNPYSYSSPLASPNTTEIYGNNYYGYFDHNSGYSEEHFY